MNGDTRPFFGGPRLLATYGWGVQIASNSMELQLRDYAIDPNRFS